VFWNRKLYRLDVLAKLAAVVASVPPPPNDLQLAVLERVAKEFKEVDAARKSPNRRALLGRYKAQEKKFTEYCRELGVEACPAPPDVLASYCLHLFDLGKTPKEVEKAIAALTAMHRERRHVLARTDMIVQAAMKHIRDNYQPRKENTPC
jgi:hypothetical protein